MRYILAAVLLLCMTMSVAADKELSGDQNPKGRDNGYVLTVGGKRVYIAGDTEDTAEMRALRTVG